jgi:hypothetical protein
MTLAPALVSSELTAALVTAAGGMMTVCVMVVGGCEEVADAPDAACMQAAS